MGRKKILVIEDDQLNMELLSDVLGKEGFDTVQKFNAADGITAAQTEKPDLIIMDISLPDLDGLEAAKKLKKQSATASIPVIALTAHAMKGDREKAIEAGCDDYLTKPIDIKVFLEKIKSYVY